MDKTTELKLVPIKSISHKDRVRVDFGNKDEWEDFKADIEKNGLISAIAVKKVDDDWFELLAGGRRLRACTELGHSHINATVYTGEIDETDMKVIELNENIKRKNLSLEEEVKSKKTILDLMTAKYGERRGGSGKGVSQAMIATMLGESPANFSRDIQLAQVIDVLPILKTAKNKSEAYNFLKKGIKEHKEEKAVAKIKDEIKSETKAKDLSPKDYLISNYKLGDFFEGIKNANSGMCSLVEIDPPYGVDLKKVKRKESISDVTEDYNEVPPEEYKAFMINTLKEAYRVTKDNGWMILWFGPEPWFEQIYQWATEVGWLGNRLPGIWVKGQGQTMQPESYLANSYEMFFYFKKTKEAKIFKPGRANVFTYKPVSPTKKTHPTERPIELIQDIISTFVSKGTIICCPFLGSGNTLLAANNLDCKAYGWELSEKYKDKFILKVHNTIGEEFRSY